MIKISDNLPNSRWKSFLSANNFTTPFQTPEFFSFYRSIPGYSAEVIAVVEGEEILALCLLTFQQEKGVKSFFSRRAIIYGGPLISDGERGKVALTALINAINKKFRYKIIYAETRNFNNYDHLKDHFKACGWKYEPYLNFQIELSGKSHDELLGALKYNRRREINISIKEGATFREAENNVEVETLYQILKDLYLDRVKLPLPPLNFFIKMHQSDIGKVFVVLHKNVIIGGSFCFFYPFNSIYTMYYCGLREYHSRIFPTHLAIWAALDFGIKNDLKFLDLMGAGKPSIEYGVRKYKAEFGGEQIEYGRFIKIFDPFLYFLGKLVLRIIKSIK
jgi:serine/alanine adding enzyme